MPDRKRTLFSVFLVGYSGKHGGTWVRIGFIVRNCICIKRTSVILRVVLVVLDRHFRIGITFPLFTGAVFVVIHTQAPAPRIRTWEPGVGFFDVCVYKTSQGFLDFPPGQGRLQLSVKVEGE